MAELTDRKRKSGEAAPAQKRERKGAARPNILVTGTPGVGKTRAAEAIAARLGLQRLGVSELAKQLSAFEEFDEARQCQVLANPCGAMELIRAGRLRRGLPACELFPGRLVRLVLVHASGRTTASGRLPGQAENLMRDHGVLERGARREVVVELRTRRGRPRIRMAGSPWRDAWTVEPWRCVGLLATATGSRGPSAAIPVVGVRGE